MKICGITCSEDALASFAAGADAVGMVCHADAPRRVDPKAVAQTAAALPPAATLVLLFVDAPQDVVETYRAVAPGAWLQFHGSENADFCARFGAPYLKSFRPRTADDVAGAMQDYPDASALVMDGGGGTGVEFDWRLVPGRAERKVPVVVAGGLHPGNVAAAIEATDPDAVDVSSGVCADGDPLRKDPAKLRDFLARAKAARGH